MWVKRLIIASAICFTVGAILLAVTWLNGRRLAQQQTVCSFHEADFCRFVNANQLDKPYVATVSDPSNPAQELDIAFADSRNYQITLKQGGEKVSEQIVADGTVYTRQKDGSWAKTPKVKPAKVVALRDIIGDASTKKLFRMGARNCGKQGCFWYQLSDTRGGGTEDVLFQPGSNLLYSIQTQPKGVAGPGETTLYHFQNVSIKAPL